MEEERALLRLHRTRAASTTAVTASSRVAVVLPVVAGAFRACCAAAAAAAAAEVGADDNGEVGDSWSESRAVGSLCSASCDLLLLQNTRECTRIHVTIAQYVTAHMHRTHLSHACFTMTTAAELTNCSTRHTRTHHASSLSHVTCSKGDRLYG